MGKIMNHTMDLTKPYKIIVDENRTLETPDIIDLKHGKIMTCEGHTFNIEDVDFVPAYINYMGPGVSFSMEWFS